MLGRLADSPQSQKTQPNPLDFFTHAKDGKKPGTHANHGCFHDLVWNGRKGLVAVRGLLADAVVG